MVIAARLHSLTDPQHARRVKLVVYCLAALWLLLALVNLVWSLVPQAPVASTPMAIVNPLEAAAGGARRPAVKIDEMIAWNLFGTPDMKLAVSDEPPIAANDAAAGERRWRCSTRPA